MCCSSLYQVLAVVSSSRCSWISDSATILHIQIAQEKSASVDMIKKLHRPITSRAIQATIVHRREGLVATQAATQ
jgi:hypothetical protein